MLEGTVSHYLKVITNILLERHKRNSYGKFTDLSCNFIILNTDQLMFDKRPDDKREGPFNPLATNVIYIYIYMTLVA